MPGAAAGFFFPPRAGRASAAAAVGFSDVAAVAAVAVAVAVPPGTACGTMIHRDDLLGPAYAGNAFVCEPVHNLVHREILRPAGATFRSERAPEDAAAEFLTSTDTWSRFVAARSGPDGALYVVDMYRLVIEHPQWIPDAWQREIGDLRRGENQGRIYRVKPRGRALRPIPRLDRADGPRRTGRQTAPAL